MTILLPLPNLDDRRWSDLVQEGRGLIPVYAPEWTDHNAHDPGITLIELLAWVAEMDVYRLNRIPDRHKRKFLALVGIRPEPPRAARAVLRVTPNDGNAPLVLPASLEFQGADAFGELTRFRTLEEVTAISAHLVALQYRDALGFHDLTKRWQRDEAIDLLGADPGVGSALYLGFDASFPSGVETSLYFSFMPQDGSDTEREALVREIIERAKACQPLPACEEDLTGPDAITPETMPPLEHPSVRLIWEVLVGTNQWRRLDASAGEIVDDTRALTLNGAVRVTLPVNMHKAALGQVSTELYYLRVRLAAGAYDAAPHLLSIALNGVLAEQAVPVGALQDMGDGTQIEIQELGQGNARPFQSFTLASKPVQEASVQIYTTQNADSTVWTLRADFDSSKRADSHFVLDATDGVVTFGDGEHGRTIPSDAGVTARYRTTRAEKGNLAANTINELADNPHNAMLLDVNATTAQLAMITNPLAATGGAAQETLEHAEGRAFAIMTEPNRAVSLTDYETLALQTPGTRLARASARANLHPSFPCYQAPGIITLIILPYLPLTRPQPSAGLLQTVRNYINRRRVIGTRVEVIGPSYREVTVRATLQAFPGVNIRDVQQKTLMALEQFFNPLPSDNGDGWEFGRDVYRSEVMQVLDGTVGVDHVVTLELLADGCDPQCGNICLPPNGLVLQGRHQITVNGGTGCA